MTGYLLTIGQLYVYVTESRRGEEGFYESCLHHHLTEQVRRPAKLFFWPGSTDFTKNFLSIFKDEKYTPTPPVNQFLLGKGPL